MKIDENILFREITLRICGTLDIETALKNTFDYLKDYIPMFHVGLNYYEPDRKGVLAVATYTDQIGGFVAPYGEEVFISLPGEIIEAIEDYWQRGNSVRKINNPEQDPIAREFLRQHHKMPDTSQLVLQLKLDDRHVGTFVVAAMGQNRFSDEHVRLLEILQEPIALAMSNLRRHRELEHVKDLLADENRDIRRELEVRSGNQVVGGDFGLKDVMAMVRQVAPQNSPVLLLGETGVGKEVIANAIHLFSSRRNKPLVRVNCGAIPDSLIDSELFGHEKGAFTGAVSAKRGRFERADRGTIFLDEIGELPLDAQVRLLRVLQDMEVERVGGTRPYKVNVRVVTATNRNLEAMVREGRFRQDLWYRLNVFPIRVPPLRERKEDIPSLTSYFIDRKAREMNFASRPELAMGAMEKLISYDWPGNVRELQNVIERSLILHQGRELDFPDIGAGALPSTIPTQINSSLNENQRPATLDTVVAMHIRQVLSSTRGKVEGDNGAAEILGMNPSTLRHKMRKLGILFGRRAKPVRLR